MIVREERVRWVIEDGSLYKQTELVSMSKFNIKGRKIDLNKSSRISPQWKSEYIREATEQDKLGNV